MTSNMKDWALWYVQAHGLAVFPLPPNKKAPGSLGIKSATRDPELISAWWDAEPDSNIAVIGCLRIDIDPKNGGDTAWAALIAQHGEPHTMKVRTPSGGMHYYLHAEATVGNSRGLLPRGIDVRGADAGYTVAPPSYTIEIPNKQCAGSYELIDPSIPIAPCPQWLLTMLAQPEVDPLAHHEPLRSDITQDQYHDLRSALMSPELLSDWEKWSDIGYALLGLGETGRELFFEYSRAQRVALPEKAVFETEDIWWRNHRHAEPRSDYRSVFSRAQALGWKNPKATDTTKLGFGASLPPGIVAAPSPGRKFEVRHGWDFANAPGIRWRIDKILPYHGVAMFYGPPAVGKSFLIIDLLMSIVRGIPYGHDQLKTEQGAALYVLAEGAAGAKQRLRAYQQANQLPANSPAMQVISDAPNLFDAADAQLLIEAIIPTGAKVVVVDTLFSSMMGGDENSAKDMGIVLGNCRRIAAAIDGLVILVHHNGKDTTRGARGSSAIPGAMETEIELMLEENGIRVAQIRKQKDGAILQWQFRLQPRVVAGPNGVEDSAIVEHVASQPVVEKKTIEKPIARSGRTDEAIFGLIQAQSGLQSEEGVELAILIATIMELRPDLTGASIRKVITANLDAGVLGYTADRNIVLKALNHSVPTPAPESTQDLPPSSPDQPKPVEPS